ncbi:MAG: hypothetical protein KF905_13145 [Flavobacteriales bacterium]|nr:hypothetical protein [Flavobacteriales bacterium]
MNKPSLFKRIMLPSLAFLLVASLGAGCSGCNGEAADTAGDAATTGADAAQNDADGHAGGDGHEGHDHSGMDGDGADGANAGTDGANGADGTGTMTAVDPWTRTYTTPAAERAGTVENLNGLRAKLVAELESVRGRLKDGTRSAADKKADSTRASELAQGLERLDRTIKQITDADDVNWAQVRESNIKAAGEFRDWMNKYGMPS